MRCLQLRDRGLTVAGTSLIKRYSGGESNARRSTWVSAVSIVKSRMQSLMTTASGRATSVVAGSRSAVVGIGSLNLLVQAVGGWMNGLPGSSAGRWWPVSRRTDGRSSPRGFGRRWLRFPWISFAGRRASNPGWFVGRELRRSYRMGTEVTGYYRGYVEDVR